MKLIQISWASFLSSLFPWPTSQYHSCLGWVFSTRRFVNSWATGSWGVLVEYYLCKANDNWKAELGIKLSGIYLHFPVSVFHLLSVSQWSGPSMPSMSSLSVVVPDFPTGCKLSILCVFLCDSSFAHVGLSWPLTQVVGLVPSGPPSCQC